jgi:hypothetical protein
MNNEFTVYTSIKADEELKGSEEKIKLTLIFEGYTLEDYQTRAIKDAVIQWAGSMRKKGQPFIQALKGEATFRVPKPGARLQAAMLPFDALVLLCTGDKAKAMGVVDKFGSVEKAIEALQEILG